MNKVIEIGRLTKDPEVRYSQSDSAMAIARYTLAVDRRFKRDGEPTADFINCIAFGKNAEFAEKLLKSFLFTALPIPSKELSLFPEIILQKIPPQTGLDHLRGSAL